MISFTLGIVALIAGYFIYGKFIEKIFVIDTERVTPAYTKQDGVDYIPLKPWRIFLIQFLNIAGVGPICGAIMGAKFGTASYLWIVLGSIFAGAVHDFLSGMVSLRNDGCSLPEIHGKYMGTFVRQLMRAYMIFLMILVGVVFVNTPATLLNTHFTPNWNIYVWVGIILFYYLIATLLPIDKIIGKIYPIFGFLLFGMALAIVGAFIYYKPAVPELWDGLSNPSYTATNPIFPMMFISIACGAISGFHATQSPLMARCMTNEKQGRPIFYGAMIAEGIVALIWAAAASYFFGPESPVQTDGLGGPAMVGLIAETWFTPVISVITILGVISASVTSGDTALRSARLIVADFLHVEQKSISKRLYIAIPLFLVTASILIFSLTDKEGFEIIWRYFGWANQLLSVFTLWSITFYLAIENRQKYPYSYLLTLFPALFMTMVCTTFFLMAINAGFHISALWSYFMAGILTLFCLMAFIGWLRRVPDKSLVK